MTTPWQTWLQNISQSQNSANAASFTTQWQAACKQWQQSMENTWESPSSYWQTVSSIQSARARTISSFWQQQPQFFAQLFQCTSFPQVVECLTRWQGHNLTSFINLNTVTQAQRSNLLSQWQRQFPLPNAASLASMWKNATASTAKPTATSSTFTNSSVNTPSQSSTAPQQATKPASTPTIHPAQPSTSSTTQSFTQSPTQSSSQSTTSSLQPSIQASVQTTTFTQATPIIANTMAAPQTELNLTSTAHTSLTTPETTPHPTISSTANSVMRTSSGSTIAAAAARRSVVARRTSSSRRRAAR